MLNFPVLGALEIRSGDDAVQVPGDLQRIMVQTLLVSEGRLISADAPAGEMRSDDVPGTRANALQAHVSRFRRRLRSLEPERKAHRLVLRPSGYR